MNSPDADNGGVIDITASATAMTLNSGIKGTATVLPLSFSINGQEAMRIDASGATGALTRGVNVANYLAVGTLAGATGATGSISAVSQTNTGGWLPSTWSTAGSYIARSSFGGGYTLVNTGGTSDGFTLTTTGTPASSLTFYYGAGATGSTATQQAWLSSNGAFTSYSMMSGLGATGATGTITSVGGAAHSSLNVGGATGYYGATGSAVFNGPVFIGGATAASYGATGSLSVQTIGASGVTAADITSTGNVGTSTITVGTGATGAAGSITTSGLITAPNLTINGASVNTSIAPTGSGTVTITSGATGAMNNVNIGATTRGTGAFTTLGANSTVTLNPTTTAVTITSGATGAMDNVNIGVTTPGTGKFTTLTATGTTTLATSLTGLLKASSGVVSTATSGTDYSPAIAVTDDGTTNASYYPLMSSVIGATGSGVSLSTAYTSNSKLYFNPSTGTINATIFNSLSDANKKQNVASIQGAVSTVNKLNGVSFEWKDNSLPSYGVIAQDIEKVIPEIVSTDKDGAKSVNYNGIIGFLINAIKEQQAQIDELKEKINGNVK